MEPLAENVIGKALGITKETSYRKIAKNALENVAEKLFLKNTLTVPEATLTRGRYNLGKTTGYVAGRDISSGSRSSSRFFYDACLVGPAMAWSARPAQYGVA